MNNKRWLNCFFTKQPIDYSITFNSQVVDVSKLPLLDMLEILNQHTYLTERVMKDKYKKTLKLLVSQLLIAFIGSTMYAFYFILCSWISFELIYGSPGREWGC